MITKEKFLTPFTGHANAYSRYQVIDVTLDDLVEAINKIGPDMNVGSGKVSDTGRSISFEIFSESPELIHKITKQLNCHGFADTDSWYGDGRMVASECGNAYDQYTADWAYDCPVQREEDPGLWDAFVMVTDKKSGEKFCTGEGCVDSEAMQMWTEIVHSHT